MKTFLQILLLFLGLSTIDAQSSIQIQINHLLDAEPFELSANSQNDLNHDFMLERLEYYLSTFIIEHDGGQIIEVEDLYVLIDMAENPENTIIDLGEFDIQTIERVKFHFGIDKVANHADPALWPEDHPLAPKFPSMHWGWAAGYRFIALEGMSGPNVDQMLQFHCIGDEFYKELNFPVTKTEGNVHTVEIEAEYSKLLSNIDISNGLILHGNLGAIQTLAANLQEKVFTAAEITITKDNDLVRTFEVYPNPSPNHQIFLNVDVAGSNPSIQLIDIMGRTILNAPYSSNQLVVPGSGIYFLTLVDVNGKTLASRKVIVQ